MRQGARDYIVKPVKRPDLLAKISALGLMAEKISLRDYQRELAERLRDAESRAHRVQARRAGRRARTGWSIWRKPAR